MKPYIIQEVNILSTNNQIVVLMLNQNNIKDRFEALIIFK